jgi:hypothetical protein
VAEGTVRNDYAPEGKKLKKNKGAVRNDYEDGAGLAD